LRLGKEHQIFMRGTYIEIRDQIKICYAALHFLAYLFIIFCFNSSLENLKL